MRTQLMIMLIVSAVFLSAVVGFVGLVLLLGWLGGVAVGLGVVAVAVAAYWRGVKPWHMRWGATDAEVVQSMPGDELIPGAGQAARAITIEAPPMEVWPWLVQLGYGKAGWYSYDWIANDFQPSPAQRRPDHPRICRRWVSWLTRSMSRIR